MGSKTEDRMGRGMKGAVNGALTFPANKANHTLPRALMGPPGREPATGQQGARAQALVDKGHFITVPADSFMSSEQVISLSKLSNSSLHKIHHFEWRNCRESCSF